MQKITMHVLNHPERERLLRQLRSFYGLRIPFAAIARSFNIALTERERQMVCEWDRVREANEASRRLDSAIADVLGEEPDDPPEAPPARLPPSPPKPMPLWKKERRNAYGQ